MKSIGYKKVKLRNNFIPPSEFLAYTKGNLTATFDRPDQASVNVPVNKITFVNDTLYIAMDFAGLTFVGTMNYENEVTQGQFSPYGLLSMF